MAADAVGLLDHLEVRRAHVVGASMGGMIAQTVAIEHPDRVLSLTSIMSNEGGRLKGQPTIAGMRLLLKAAPTEREAYLDHVEKLYKAIGSPGFPADLEAVRARAARGYERGGSRAGVARQLLAVGVSPNRTPGLKRLRMPVTVVHGNKDILVRISGGRAVAAAVPGAKLIEIDGMGHDLAPGLWPRIIDAIAETAARAETDSVTALPR
jgi:pimeloyl-ACP methyl ester carboxylesterase